MVDKAVVRPQRTIVILYLGNIISFCMISVAACSLIVYHDGMDAQTIITLKKALRAVVTKEGTLRKAAKKLGVGASYICEVQKGKKAMTHAMAEKLGFSWKLVKDK